jgi:hypothetical protein
MMEIVGNFVPPIIVSVNKFERMKLIAAAEDKRQRRAKSRMVHEEKQAVIQAAEGPNFTHMVRSKISAIFLYH